MVQMIGIKLTTLCLVTTAGSESPVPGVKNGLHPGQFTNQSQGAPTQS